MKKVLLIGFYAPSGVGIRILSSILKKKYDISFLFFMEYGTFEFYTKEKRQSELELEDIITFCKNYDYVLFSSSSFDKKITFLIADMLKKAMPEIKIVIGGPLGIFEAKEAIRHCDALCVWEGENILDVFDYFEKHKKIENIPNFIFKDQKNIPKLKTLLNLDDLPFPDYENKNQFFYTSKKIIRKKDFFPKYVMFETMRGCIFNCTYCHISRINEIKKENRFSLLTYKSVERVIQELSYLIKNHPDIERFYALDENFLLRDEKDLIFFVKEYNKKIRIPLILQTDFRTPRFFDKVKTIAELQCYFEIVIGVQTGSEKLNRKVYHRIQENRDIYEKYYKMKELFDKKKCRYSIYLQMMYGHPEETKKDIIESINILLSFPKKTFKIYAFSPLPHIKNNKRFKGMELNLLGMPTLKHLKDLAFYYFYLFFCSHLKGRNLGFILPKKFKDNAVFRLLNKIVPARLYLEYIVFSNRRYQRWFNKKVLEPALK